MLPNSLGPVFVVSLLLGLVSPKPLDNQEVSLDKRAGCASFGPGSISTPASNSPFLICNQAPSSVHFTFQTDGNFVAYSASNSPLWNSGSYGYNCASGCDLVYQSDGNLVAYDNGVAIWNTGTGGNVGRGLYFQNTAPYLYIVNGAGQIIWES